MNDYVRIPSSLFVSERLTYVTQSLGMWLCFLLQNSENHSINITINELEGYVGERLMGGDIYRLASIVSLITYQEHENGQWTITLNKEHIVEK